jgi:hypothetical protein
MPDRFEFKPNTKEQDNFFCLLQVLNPDLKDEWQMH